jgi:hypothetical protein
VGNDNYEPCDCGFSGIIGFDDSFIFELGEFGSKEPTGCFPGNFWIRDNSGEIKNLVITENKITFNIVAQSLSTWNWFTEIEIVGNELIVTSSTTTIQWTPFVQRYVKSDLRFSDYCK